MFEQFPEEDGIITFRPVGGTIEYGEDSKSAVKGLIGLRGSVQNKQLEFREFREFRELLIKYREVRLSIKKGLRVFLSTLFTISQSEEESSIDESACMSHCP